MNKLKNKSGITLIALVVTIIVLLILAGISIQMLTGDNGILNRAGEAKGNTDIAQTVEQARLDILAKFAEKKGQDPTEDEVKDILKKYFTEDSVNALTDLTTLTQEITTKTGGYAVKLSEVLDGVKIATSSEGQKLTEIVDPEDYGKAIDYSVTVNGTTLNNWKVFLNDNTNVYIILGEYLDASLVPSSTGIDTDTDSYRYCVWSNTNRDTLLNGLTTTNYWEDFAKGVSEATATGSPTKEQLEASYGQGTLDFGTITGDLYVLPFEEPDDPDDLYNLCIGYWLASPHLDITYAMWRADAEGNVSIDNIIGAGERIIPHCIGIRPLVKLPSDITGRVDSTVTIDK